MMIGKDDWYLAEGLLTIFLRGNAKQTLVFRRDKSDRSIRMDESDERSRFMQNAVLDLGSCKETISLYPSS